MKTKLAQKPLVRGWMSPASKKFRKDFPKFVEKLPKYSFLDQKSFKIDGYFVGQNIGSIVLRIRDKKGVYVVKSVSDSKELVTEVAFLREWKRVGANTVKVLDLVTPKKDFPVTVAILEYISTRTTEEELLKKQSKMAATYKRLGQSLTLLHKAKGKGFGRVMSVKGFKGEYPTYGKERMSFLNLKRQKNLLKHKLVEKKDLQLIPRAIEIVEKDIRRGTKPTLNHNDAGLFNTFGLSSLKFFDPNPKVSHPLEDLAVALIWATFEKNSKQMREALVRGYKSKQKYDEQVLQACLFLKLLQKWEWWMIRGKSEKYAFTWVKRTKGLFVTAKKQLEKA